MSQEFLNFMMIVNVLAGQSAVQNGRSGVLTSIWETVENRQVIRRRFPGWRGSDGSDFGLQDVFSAVYEPWSSGPGQRQSAMPTEVKRL